MTDSIRKLPVWLPLLAINLWLAVPARAVTLADYAPRHPLVIQTFHADEKVFIEKNNQVNNLQNGGKVLNLSGKGLTALDGISGLQVLDEGRTNAITQVARLQLFLNENDLTNVPDEFAALTNLTFVYLNHNRLRAIPPAIARLPELQGMYFTDNEIAEIPPAVFAMRQLRKLQVSKNRLQEIPAAIGNLTNLIHLNLSDNVITNVPDGVAHLKRLRVCDFSDNRLTRLPEAFGSVKILYQLRVRNNPLTNLPAGFAGMPGTIDITGTRIRTEDLAPELRARISTEKPAVKPSVIKNP